MYVSMYVSMNVCMYTHTHTHTHTHTNKHTHTHITHTRTHINTRTHTHTHTHTHTYTLMSDIAMFHHTQQQRSTPFLNPFPPNPHALIHPHAFIPTHTPHTAQGRGQHFYSILCFALYACRPCSGP